MNGHKFPYKWYLKNGYPAAGIESNGLKVFGTFICGGGSTMGYKLAGFEHLGGVEIDKSIAAIYHLNHNPKYLYNEDMRDFVNRTNLPDELYQLDLLDGSPPCSSFSMAGNRESDWDKKKVFREGQEFQKLDDLFFTFIELARKLQPKVIIAENVKGLISGNAKFYVSRIKKEFEAAGFIVQLFLLNAAVMGVPQKRERVFFICQRMDLKMQRLVLTFNEENVFFKDVKINQCTDHECFEFPESERIRLSFIQKGDRDLRNADFRYRKGDAFWNQKLIYDNEVAGTVTAQEKQFVFSEKRRLSNKETKLIGSYPLDYNFLENNPKYLIGMSVPPVMTAQIAHQIYLQWSKNTA